MHPKIDNIRDIFAFWNERFIFFARTVALHESIKPITENTNENRMPSIEEP